MGFLQIAQKEKIVPVISLKAIGIKKYSDFSRLKEFLQNRTKIVKNIYPCRFEWQQANFEIEMLGDVQFLVDELTQTGRYAIEAWKTGKSLIEIDCM